VYALLEVTMMPTIKQIEKRERVEEAAYALLKASGYKATSMLAIAERASVSNETLYKWYGNKQGLFRSLVEANARKARELLGHALHVGTDPIDTLNLLGPVLLSLVVGERAIILNRAAAADTSDTKTLGAAIAKLGRQTIAPLLRDLLQSASRSGIIVCPDAASAADIYLRLLIGDLQIRRVIGVCDELSASEIQSRADEATALFMQLHASPRTENSPSLTGDY
jgi:AcrR family transcriptional regulator